LVLLDQQDEGAGEDGFDPAAPVGSLSRTPNRGSALAV